MNKTKHSPTGEPLIRLLLSMLGLSFGALSCSLDDPQGPETRPTESDPALPGHTRISARSPETAATPDPRLVAADSCSAISARADNRRQPADIVIGVDNSGSMEEEIGFVRSELNAFSEQIVASGIDVRIILISAGYTPPRPAGGGSHDNDDDDEDDESDADDDNGICIDAPLGSGVCPRDSNLPRYLHVEREVKSHNALNLIIDTFPQWQDQLRPDATKTFVVVTDDNAQDGPNASAAAFAQSVASLPGELFERWSFSGIFCQHNCPEAAAVGTVYQQLADDTAGVAGDLCQQNFAPVFDALANAVIEGSGLACAWNIPVAPPGQTFDRAKVNVQYGLGGATMTLLQVPDHASCADRAAWYYDNAFDPTQILVCPAACAALERDVAASFDVLFGCQTERAPD